MERLQAEGEVFVAIFSQTNTTTKSIAPGTTLKILSLSQRQRGASFNDEITLKNIRFTRHLDSVVKT